MRITKVRYWQEDLALSRPYTIAYKTIDSVHNVFLVLELANGKMGIGAASPAPFVTGEAIEDTLAALAAHAEAWLLGRDIFDLHAILRQARTTLPHRPAALAALDIALHDALGHALGRSLVSWLGPAHAALPTSITIGIKDHIDEMLAEADEYLSRGFRVIKLKIGYAPDEDAEYFRRLRAHVGPDVTIRVDVNQGYSPAGLRQFAAATAGLHVEFYEQPFPPKHLHWQRELPPDLSALCAADEDLHHYDDALLMCAHPQPYGIFNIKLMKCGGIAEAMRIAEAAERSGIHLMWGCNDESVASIAAALHAALASPATRYLDLDGSLDLASDRVGGGFVLHQGVMQPAPGPGLGLKLLD